jgi:hypothetical protein
VPESELIDRARAAFRADASAPPALSLRGGAAVDAYDTPPPFDPALDEPSDAYVEAYALWALPHLDAASWRHYLPRLIDYALRHLDEPRAMVTEGLLGSLRPPDREPPRLGSLSADQETVLVAVLDVLAFDKRSAHCDLALQVLEEYWVPGALYRKGPPRHPREGPDRC